MAIKGNCVRHGDFETDHGHCPACMAMHRMAPKAERAEWPMPRNNIKAYIAEKANAIVHGARRSAYGTPRTISSVLPFSGLHGSRREVSRWLTATRITIACQLATSARSCA